MATDSVTVSPTFNGDSVSLTAGMIVRLKPGANNNVVRAQADSAPHVQGVNGVVVSGSAAPTGVVTVVCVGRQTVQMESGLTPAVGDTVYVSPNVAGKGTNVVPTEVSAIGSIADVSGYAASGSVEVDVQGPAGPQGTTGGGLLAGVITTGAGANPRPALSLQLDPVAADNVTDDTLSVRNWLSQVAPNAGADILIPTGTVRLTGPIVSASQNGVTVRGRGRGSCTTLRADDSAGNYGDIFTFRNSFGCALRDLTFTSNTQRTAGWGVVSMGGDPARQISGAYPFGANACSIERVDFTNMFGALQVCDDLGPPLVGNWIFYANEINIENVAGDGVFLNATNGASHFFSRIFVWNNPVVVGPSNAAFHVQGSGDFNFRECEAFGVPYGLLIDPGATVSGQRVLTGRFAKCFFDSAGIRTGYINVGGTGQVGDLDFEGGWFATSNEHGMLLSGVGTTDVRFRGVQFIHNANFGLVYNGVTYCTADANCVFAANRSGGALFTAGASHCAVRNSTGRSTSPIATAVQPVGVQLNAGCAHNIVTGNDMIDCTTPFIDNSGDVDKNISGNLPDSTLVVVGKFSGVIVTSAGAASSTQLGDPGSQPVINSNSSGNIEYPTSARTIRRLRVCAESGNGATAYTVTLYKRPAGGAQAATAMQVTVPPSTTAGAVFVDSAHPITFADGDTYALQVDVAATGEGNQALTATLEGPPPGP